MKLHPACEPLAFLLGTWRGSGHGDYPTIDAFSYTEEVTFGHVGKPFLSYQQGTRDAAGQPLHAETGYVRALDGGDVELVVAQPSGIVEVHHGHLDGRRIEFVCDTVATTASAKSVTSVRRVVEVVAESDKNVLVYDLEMEAVGEPMTHHLHARLVGTS